MSVEITNITCCIVHGWEWDCKHLTNSETIPPTHMHSVNCSVQSCRVISPIIGPSYWRWNWWKITSIFRQNRIVRAKSKGMSSFGSLVILAKDTFQSKRPYLSSSHAWLRGVVRRSKHICARENWNPWKRVWHSSLSSAVKTFRTRRPAQPSMIAEAASSPPFPMSAMHFKWKGNNIR